MPREKINIINKREVDVFTIEYRSDGLLHLHAKGDEIKMAHYKAVVKSIGEMTGGKKVPVLCTANEFLIPDQDVRKYMTTPESNPYSLASALVIHSIAQKLIANFFVNVMKPARPIRMFTSKEEAVKWLKKFL